MGLWRWTRADQRSAFRALRAVIGALQLMVRVCSGYATVIVYCVHEVDENNA
jgi:hypothetical protein